jgi:predicted ABC-class ATPase
VREAGSGGPGLDFGLPAPPGDGRDRVVDARRHVQVADGDLGAVFGERLGRYLRQVPHQRPDGHVLLT